MSLSWETGYKKLRSKFIGMEVSEARRLQDLGEENSKLKRLVADRSPDKLALEDVLKKI